MQRVDLFYFSGTAQNGFLYLPAEGAPLLFIKQSVTRAREESALDRIVDIATVKDVPGRVADIRGRPPVRLAMELDVLPVNEFRFYRGLFKPKECLDGSPLIERAQPGVTPGELFEDALAMASRLWFHDVFLGPCLTIFPPSPPQPHHRPYDPCRTRRRFSKLRPDLRFHQFRVATIQSHFN